MKKILAVILASLMLFGTMAVGINAEAKVYTTWEELAAYEGLPYYNLYPTGKTPQLDAAIGADEYTLKIEMADMLTYNAGGLLEEDLPEYVDIYLSVDAEYVYLGVKFQLDEKEYYPDIDFRFTLDFTSNKKLENVYYDESKAAVTYKNICFWNYSADTATAGDVYNGIRVSGLNFETDKTSVIVALNGVHNTGNANKSDNYTLYEAKLSKAGIKAEWDLDGNIEYMNFGVWFLKLVGKGSSRIGYGWEIPAEVSMATDFVLAANNPSYDLDDHVLCVRFSDEPEAPPTTEVTTVATTTEATTTAATTTAAATTTKATTAAATTAAATTTAATTEEDGGCKSALAVSAIALLPALGVALVASKRKKED